MLGGTQLTSQNGGPHRCPDSRPHVSSRATRPTKRSVMPQCFHHLDSVKNRMGYIQVANMESASLLLPKNNTTTGRATIMGKTVLSMALPSGIEDVPQDVKQKRPVASQREDAISEFSERVRAPLLHQIWPHRANDHRST